MSNVEVIKEFFGETSTPVAVATCDGDKPSVRFLAFKMYENDKIYFLTAKSKNFYKELERNPKVQICSMPNKKNEWVRMDAEVRFTDDVAMIQKAFDIFPFFQQVYQSVDNKEIALFYLDNVKAKKQSVMGAEEEL